MKKKLIKKFVLCLSITILWVISCHWNNTDLQDLENYDYMPWEVLVKYKMPSWIFDNWINISKSNTLKSLETNLSKQNLSIKNTIEQWNIAVVSIQDGKSVEETIELLQKNKNIEYAEPNYIRHLYSIDTDDTYRENLWWLDNHGQIVNWNNWTQWEDIDRVNTYQVFSGSFTEFNTWIIIWVLDAWINYNHEDLINNIQDGTWYDFVNEDDDPMPAFITHGTHVAGTIAATINNGKWIIWVNPNAKILSLKITENWFMTDEDEIEAIDYAIQNWIKIINASRWWYWYSTWLYEAIERFKNAWWLFITAAWNETNNNDGAYSAYPCSYNLDNIICVAATTQNWWLANFSNYWNTSVDIWAPWVNILSTVIDEDSNLFYKEDFSSYNDLTGLYDSWRISWWDGEIRIYTGFIAQILTGAIMFYDEIANSWTYLESPWIDTSIIGDNDIWINAFLWCRDDVNDEYLELQINTGAWRETARLYREDFYTIDNTYLNIWKASNLKYRFYFHDILSRTGFECDIYEVSLKSSKWYEWPNNLYAYLKWTSMATPHVAGLASLARSFRPDLSYLDIKNAIVSNWDSLPALASTTVYWKRINAYNTLYALDNYAPVNPELLSPSNTSEIILWNTTWQIPFERNTSHDTWVWISWYIFELSQNNEFNTLITWITTNNTWLIIDFSNIWTYYWRVKAFDKKWNTWEYSDIYTFEIDNWSWSMWCIINYSTRTPTSWDVLVILSGCNEDVFITNNDWNSWYLFTDNWTFTFEFEDWVWNTWEKIANVNWIDKIPPTCNISYNPKITTSWNITATLTNCNENIIVTNNNWSIEYTFTNNWSFTFNFKDTVWFTWEAIANVNLIDREPPDCTIEYNPSTSTHWNVTAILTGCTEEIIRSEISHTFTDNGNYTFNITDLAGNPKEIIASVSWISKSSWGGWWGGWWTGQWIAETLINQHLFWTNESWNNSEENNNIESNDKRTRPTFKKPDFSRFNYWDPQKKLQNWYTIEMNNAYTFAFSIGITTMPTIEEASMNWNLTRIAMAKMLSKFATNILWLKPDTAKECNFSDVTEQMDSNYDNGITLACQLWIMWVGINKFRPKDNVNRAEFGTALSRMLFGLKDGKDNYYSTHLKRLYNEWIINNTNPELQERRWYIMLMLMRSVQ